MREPDALDAARVLVLAAGGIAGAWVLASLGLPAAAAVLQEGAFIGAPLLYARWAGLNPWRANGFVRVPLRKLAIVLIASLGTFWLLNGLTHVQTEFFRVTGLKKQADQATDRIRRGIEQAEKGGAVPALALLVIVPPLCEETLFRGILLRGLASRFGFGVALGATSLLFAFLHQWLVQGMIMLFLACYFGTLVFLTGSLWSSILAHAVNNFAVLALTWAFGDRVQDLEGPWWMYGLSALVVGVALAALAADRDPPTA